MEFMAHLLAVGVQLAGVGNANVYLYFPRNFT
jgi:hypothetical protein